MAATDLMRAVPGLPPFTCETILFVMKARLLRYGGVSTLGMAGYPEYFIAFLWCVGVKLQGYARFQCPSNAISVAVSHTWPQQQVLPM